MRPRQSTLPWPWVMTGLSRNNSQNLRSPRFWGRPPLFGRQLLLTMAAAEKACRMSRTLLASARTCTHTTSERLSPRGSLTEPGLHRRRREQVPHELLPQCSHSGMPVELCLEVLLPRSRSHCLASNGRISFLEKFPTDELYPRRLQLGGIPLPRSIQTLVVLEQVPTRSRTRLAVLTSKS